MNCHECQQQFDAMLGGKIESTARSAAETHLRECAQCAQAFAESRRLWELLGSAPVRDASHGFADRILRQLDTEPVSAARWWNAWSVSLRWTAATATVVVTIGITCFAVYRHQQQEKQLAHFEELFNLVQNVDPETLVNVVSVENGDAL